MSDHIFSYLQSLLELEVRLARVLFLRIFRSKPRWLFALCLRFSFEVEHQTPGREHGGKVGPVRVMAFSETLSKLKLSIGNGLEGEFLY